MIERMTDWWFYLDRRKKVTFFSIVVFLLAVGSIFAIKNMDFSGNASVDTIAPQINLVVDKQTLTLQEATGISCSAIDESKVSSITLKANGKVLCTSDTRCASSFSAETPGTFAVECTAVDISKNQDTKQVTITVQENSGAQAQVVPTSNAVNETPTQQETVNHLPEWAFNFADQTIDEDSNLSIVINASDEDNQTLTYSVNPATFTIDSKTGNFTYIPPKNFFGDVFANISVSDAINITTKQLKITVRPVNDAPLADAGLDLQGQANTIISLNGKKSADVENTSLTYQWSLALGSAAYNISSGTETSPVLNITFSTEGVRIFQLRIADGELNSFDNVTVTIAGVYNCAESWFCSDWETCQENNQSTRNCIDVNNCNSEEGKPATMQECVFESGNNPTNTSLATGNVIGAGQIELGWEFAAAFIGLMTIFGSLLILVMYNHHGKKRNQ